jgi:ribosome biogenesis GTPase
VASLVLRAYPRRVTEPHVGLADLGWDDAWREALYGAAGTGARRAVRGEEPGLVSRVDRGLCIVLTASGPVRASLGADLLEALARDSANGPCTGDWCRLRHWSDGPVTVEALAPRRSVVLRADASRTSRGQALAANVDVVAIVVALHPEPHLTRIERLLTIAWASGATPAVILTKSDLVVDAEEVAEDVRVAASGVEVLVCSATSGEGIGAVRSLVGPGRTMALVGASGHGKSSLVNALVGVDLLTTRAIRSDGKGRHTTVRRELVLAPGGGAIIDTPGMRGVGLQLDEGALAAAFPDVDELTSACRFRDCSHKSEPGCAVLAAVERGELSVRRWESWQRLLGELERTRVRVDARRRLEEAKSRRRPFRP